MGTPYFAPVKISEFCAGAGDGVSATGTGHPVPTDDSRKKIWILQLRTGSHKRKLTELSPAVILCKTKRSRRSHFPYNTKNFMCSLSCLTVVYRIIQ
jgi:hypothetical protein